MSSFVHLHVHSDGSLLDGMATVDEYAQLAAADGQPAVAVTDHGSLAKTLRLVQACDGLGTVKPILGIEAYVAIDDDRFEQNFEMIESHEAVVEESESDSSTSATVKKKIYHHVTILARNTQGWKNLMRIHAESWKHFWSKPRIDTALIEAHSEGLIILTGCLGGMIANPLSRGDRDVAKKNLERFIDVVGHENVYVEVMDHGLDIERQGVIPQLVELAEEYDLPLVATNDCHYGPADNAEAHDAWLALQSSKGKKSVKLDDPKRFRFNGSGYHLRSSEEMRDVFSAENIRSLVKDIDAEIEKLNDKAENLIDDVAAFGAGAALGSVSDLEELRKSQDEGIEVDPDFADELFRLLGAETTFETVKDKIDDRVFEAGKTSGNDALRHIATLAEMIEGTKSRRQWWVSQASAVADGEDFWTVACDNTLAVADRIDAETMPPPSPRLPHYDDIPEQFNGSRDDYLRHLIYEGARKKFGEDLPAVITERIESELEVIIPMGFSDYFLIVWDFMTWARSQGIKLGRGRGSAAGAFIAYCLSIVGVDALRHNLLFERFLEPGRPDFPDMDLDVEKDRRPEALDYLSRRWGASMVAKIGTYGQSLTKWALQSAARLLGDGDESDSYRFAAGVFSDAVPVAGGKPMSIDKLDDGAPGSEAFWDAVEASEYGDTIVDLARELVGYATNAGIHACGILLGDEELESVVPLRIDRDTGYYVTEWEGQELDGYGCLKLDVLGIRNLDVVAAAVENHEKLTGEHIDVDDLPDPDDTSDPRVAAAWDIIGSGHTEGLFQIESSGMQELCRSVRPRSMAHLSAVLALYRPGPLSAGMHISYAQRKADVEHDPNTDTSGWYEKYTSDPRERDVIDSILSETYGTLVYQEQMMRLSGVVAGFDANWRSKLRKAVGKKKKDLMDAVGERFFAQGPEEQTDEDGKVTSIAFSPETVQRLWDDFKDNADYAFNASHSYAYSDLTFTTAFLKANGLAAFSAGLLSKTEKADKRQSVLTSLMREGIDVSSPDVTVSDVKTAPVDQSTVAFGLSEVKDVGLAAAQAILEAREEKPFESLADFFARTSGKSVSYTALAEAGALDSLMGGPSRRRGVSRISKAVKDWPGIGIPETEWNPVERGLRQSNRISIIPVNDHPIKVLAQPLGEWRFAVEDDWFDEDGSDGEEMEAAAEEDSVKGRVARAALNRMTIRSISTALSSQDNDPINCVGLVSSTRLRYYTKREGRLLAVELQSTTGQVEVVFFDRQLTGIIKDLGRMPVTGDILCVSGTVRVKESFTPSNSDDPESAEDQVSELVRQIVGDTAIIVDPEEDLMAGMVDNSVPRCDLADVFSFYRGGGEGDPVEAPEEEPPAPEPIDDAPVGEVNDEVESDYADDEEQAETEEPPEPEAEPEPEPVEPAAEATSLPDGAVTIAWLTNSGGASYREFYNGSEDEPPADATSRLSQHRKIFSAISRSGPPEPGWYGVYHSDGTSYICVRSPKSSSPLDVPPFPAGHTAPEPLSESGNLSYSTAPLGSSEKKTSQTS